jgi:hypothetical protein
MSLPDQFTEEDKKHIKQPTDQEAAQEEILDLVDKTAAQKKGEDKETSEQEKEMESEGG